MFGEYFFQFLKQFFGMFWRALFEGFLKQLYFSLGHAEFSSELDHFDDQIELFFLFVGSYHCILMVGFHE